jgi:NAD(P)-dependent dehydrogenase (short-subunit alcohol dehydrogenase family)
VRLILDAHISGAKVAAALRKAGHDVLSVDEERSLDGWGDEELLDLATSEQRVMVTCDVKDFPDILRTWAEAGKSHAGCMIVVGVDHGEFGLIGKLVRAAIARYPSQDDWRDRSVFLSRYAGNSANPNSDAD